MNVYQDIAQRTNGDIYIGVVGPVRTGKSTFIKKIHGNAGIAQYSKSDKKRTGAGRTPSKLFGQNNNDCGTEIYTCRSG